MAAGLIQLTGTIKLVAFGDPILCDQIDEPSNAQIDELHAKMVAGFKQVFDKHKDAYGWPNKSIVFV